MVDQLSFRLDPDLPRLPHTLQPMLAVATSEAFDSPDFLFEPTWGGRRVLAFIGPAVKPHEAADGHGEDVPVLRMVDVHGLDLVPRAPELADLRDHLSAQSAVLDGELVVVDRRGVVDHLALASRLRGKPGAPLVYLAFDILDLDGRPLLATPLERRREVLRRVLRAGDTALAVPGIVGEGRALHAATSEAGIAGVTARLRRSPYLPGVRSRMWQFIAGTASLTAAPEAAAGDPETPPKDDGLPGPDDAGSARTPMLALIRSLRLDDD